MSGTCTVDVLNELDQFLEFQAKEYGGCDGTNANGRFLFILVVELREERNGLQVLCRKRRYAVDILDGAHRETDPLCAKVRKNLQIMLFLHIISRRLSKK